MDVVNFIEEVIHETIFTAEELVVVILRENINHVVEVERILNHAFRGVNFVFDYYANFREKSREKEKRILYLRKSLNIWGRRSKHSHSTKRRRNCNSERKR